MASSDALDLLLPGETEEGQRRARTWVSFMRLLVDDARPAAAGVVGVDLARATDSLDEHVAATVERFVRGLLAAHLEAHLAPSRRGEWILGGEVSLGSIEDAWSALGELRRERSWVASVPAPGESALDVARRLLGSLERVAEPAETELWRARLAFAEKASDAGERAERRLRRALTESEDGAGRARLVAGLAELHLERGAVHLAASLLEEHPEVSVADQRLLELRVLTALLRGEVTEARSLRALIGVGSGRLPEALVELRERVPEWLVLLPGEGRGDAGERRVEEGEPFACEGRAAVGAALFAVFTWTPGGVPRALHVEVSPGWRRRLEPWLEERDDVCSIPGTLEQQLVATAEGRIAHRLDASLPIRGALGGAETRALALWPMRDVRGEVRAWLHLELEHHLVPPRDRLERLAHAWQRGLASRLAATPEVVAPDDPPMTAGLASGEPVGARDPRASFFRRLAEGSGMKTAQRRWWGLAFEGDSLRVVASDGGSLDDWRERPGSARAVERAAHTLGPVVFSDPDATLAVHGEASSGMVLPLPLRGFAAGFLVVESERRRDFRDDDVDRHFRAACQGAPRLRAASFRAWHRARYDVDLYFDVDGNGFGRRALDFALAGRASEPVVVVGPRGVGKETLARWLHFEGPRPGGDIFVVRCGASTRAELEEALAYLTPGADAERDEEVPATLVVKDLDRLEPDLQGRLLIVLDARARGRTRLVATLESALVDAASAGALLPGLACRLERLQLFVPALADRRLEIPGLVRHASRHFAAEEGAAAPEWSDAALALLWRQPWAGNVRELENVVYKLVLLHGGERVGPDEVRAVARRFRLTLQKRLPSRRPRRKDLLAALRLTRKRSGNPNKTRAALYLGWDPDTLVARLRDAGIDPDAPFAAGGDDGAGGHVPEDDDLEPEPDLARQVDAPTVASRPGTNGRAASLRSDRGGGKE